MTIMRRRSSHDFTPRFFIGGRPMLKPSRRAMFRRTSTICHFSSRRKGFHAKEGIQVDLVSIGRADVQLQALVAGELHFANINADNIIA